MTPRAGQVRILHANGGVLRVRDSGHSKPALVFLCDPPVTIEAHDDLITAFDAQFWIIVVELPNFGFSRGGSLRSATFDGAVDIVEDALKQLELGGCLLFGPCICGFVAAELARRDELAINGIVLLQTPDKLGLLEWVERMDPRGYCEFLCSASC